MSFFDILPYPLFMALTLAGVAIGFVLRLWVHVAGLKRDRLVENRQERFTWFVGALSQSAAIGLALTLVAALLAATQTSDPRLLAGLSFGVAVVTSFLGAFLRALIRRLFYTDF